MPEHKVADPVQAYPCFGVYADYDANAPDTKTFFLVATKELAEEVCEVLNDEPRKWSTLAYVEGWEHTKSFHFRPEFTQDPSTIFTSLEALQKSDHLEEDDQPEDE